ncbi:interleukin-10 receptor subunit alpha [Syngnathoides biaculeatus]|uniref:interleukin-10 receptor subunit alpha n=1 Tax=Syngnathoides biaculeatus TaxID=300417 RepID=UPI002ADDD97E|nr:interleukin-10 receptor subunit alpha [Syngnathoides biaculeatus]
MMPLCSSMMIFVVPGTSMRNKTLGIALLFISIVNGVSGLRVPRVDNLSVDIEDDEVIALWSQTQNASSDIQYNVQMAKLADEWAMVLSCTGITKTYCDLSGLIHDYAAGYKVRVQAVHKNHTSQWAMKKFLPNTSNLQPPSFTLYATSSTITIHVHQKPILKKLFPFGVTYVIHLKERSRNSKEDVKETIVYLTDAMDQRSTTFNFLQWGVEYCVKIMVEGNAALSRSDLSPEQCLIPPEQEWFIISVSSLTTLGVLTTAAILAVGLLCHLRRPAKTPAALKSPAHWWRPLTVREGLMEVVTDKGWFLSGDGASVKNSTETPENKAGLLEEHDRRTSLDSGFSVECNAAERHKTTAPGGQEDSGCGSMGVTVYPQQVETVQKSSEDSGVGLWSRLESSSVNTISQESPSLKEFDSYCKQSPVLHGHHHEGSKQIHPCPVLAKVVSGYQAGPQSCICSGVAKCSWCLQRIVYEAKTIHQHGSALSKEFSNDPRRTRIDTTEAFPLLTALTQEMDLNMNSLAISLCDVQLDNN